MPPLATAPPLGTALPLGTAPPLARAEASGARDGARKTDEGKEGMRSDTPEKGRAHDGAPGARVGEGSGVGWSAVPGAPCWALVGGARGGACDCAMDETPDCAIDETPDRELVERPDEEVSSHLERPRSEPISALSAWLYDQPGMWGRSSPVGKTRRGGAPW